MSSAKVISGKTEVLESTGKCPLICQMESGLIANSWWGEVGSRKENAVHSGMNRRRKWGVLLNVLWRVLESNGGRFGHSQRGICPIHMSPFFVN